MSREEQITSGIWEVYNKMIWLNKYEMERKLGDYKSSEVHCIEYIGKNRDANVTKLAERFYMTRSATSKISRRLIKKGVIESYQRPENRKEIYFRLTEQGREVYEVHEKLHREFQERDKIVYDQMTGEQLDHIQAFLEKYSGHLNAEIEKIDTCKG